MRNRKQSNAGTEAGATRTPVGKASVLAEGSGTGVGQASVLAEGSGTGVGQASVLARESGPSRARTYAWVIAVEALVVAALWWFSRHFSA